MKKSEKRTILILLGLFALFSMIIAGSLSELSFSPGLPPPEIHSPADSTGRGDVRSQELTQNAAVSKSIVITVVAVFGLGAAAFIIRRVKFRNLKSALTGLIPPVLILAGIVGLYVLLMSDTPYVMGATEKIAPAAAPNPVPAGGAPDTLPLIMGAVLALVMGVIVVRLITSRKKQPSLSSAIESASLQAKYALETGENLRAVIIRYYRTLCAVLAEEQALEREEFSTVKEFEAKLTGAGAPPQPVRVLTSLFETVRYGTGNPPPDSGKTALHSLEAIIGHFRAVHPRDAHEKK